MIKLTMFCFNKRLWRCQKKGENQVRGHSRQKNYNQYPLAESCTLYRLSVCKRSLYAPEKRCFKRKLQKIDLYKN